MTEIMIRVYPYYAEKHRLPKQTFRAQLIEEVPAGIRIELPRTMFLSKQPQQYFIPKAVIQYMKEE